MKRLRVLQLLPDFSLGGAERMVVNLVRAFDTTRVEAAVASFYDPLGTVLEEILDRSSIPVFFLGKRPGFDPRLFLRVDRVLRRFRPDVVHTHLRALRYALPSMLLRRIRVKVHTVHNLAAREAGAAYWWHWMAFRRGVVPIAIGPALTTDLMSFYGLPDCPMIPNGIPVDDYRRAIASRDEWREREGIAPNDILLTTIGRLTAQKNHTLLLQAFGRVQADEPRTRLLIVGEGEERGDLERLIQRLGLTTSARLTGARNDIPDLLGAADLFVLPSAWEGNPLTILEAMAAGRPVIATDVGAVRDIIDDGITGCLVPPDDPRALGDVILRTLRSPSSMCSFAAAAARVAATTFDSSLMAKRYLGLYESLLT